MRGLTAKRIRDLEARVATQKEELATLQEELSRERLTRVSAQRGLVAYMRKHDLGHRIGYDPDKDQAVLAEVAAGRIPALENHA